MATERRPPYEKGHLIVAAIRVLTHRGGRPPLDGEVAELLDMSAELVRALIHGLAEQGIVRVLQNPFETRVEIGDYAKLESLPRESEAPRIGSELEAFHERYRERQAEMGKLFAGDEVSRRKQDRVGRLDAEFRRFRQRTGRPGEEPEPGEEAGEEE